ncbi:MAG: hypothetical protein H7251_00975, partial [Acetobacteraceae bacterium]|nr:hypothetical protein [Acetobacteraceae bacterium]
LVLAGLVALVARRFLRVPRLAGLTVLLCGRIGRAAGRFARALVRPVKTPVARVRKARACSDRARAPGLPQGRGWLVRELGWEAAGCASQLQALLDDPAMRAALAALPAAGRILRPLCRMLGVPGPIAPEVPAELVAMRPDVPAWQGEEAVILSGIVGGGLNFLEIG